MTFNLSRFSVTPMPLGIRTQDGGEANWLIPKGSAIPSRQSCTLNQRNGDGGLAISLLEGEGDGDIRRVGRVDLVTGGAPRIEVALAIGGDGVLRVTARDETSGQTLRLLRRKHEAEDESGCCCIV